MLWRPLRGEQRAPKNAAHPKTQILETVGYLRFRVCCVFGCFLAPSDFHNVPSGSRESPQICDSQFFTAPKRDSQKRGLSSGDSRTSLDSHESANQFSQIGPSKSRDVHVVQLNPQQTSRLHFNLFPIRHCMLA